MIRLLSGDCRDVLPTLPAESVQCCVTSPPYFGLRDYGTALWDGGDAACDHKQGAMRRDADRVFPTSGADRRGSFDGGERQYRDTCGKCGAVRIDRQIGLESDPETYLATMVGVFREVRRVLRRDGTCWMNMGDSYWNGGGEKRDGGHGFVDGGKAKLEAAKGALLQAKCSAAGLKPKDLLLMPARLALALQADGWWVRSDIIWHKPNPMPESCRDRPTSAHEHVFLLTRSARYWYDADAVREETPQARSSGPWGPRGDMLRDPAVRADLPAARQTSASRNLRNVWTLATHAYPEAHFATFPPELAERCIKAGTSERGCCAACGKAWGRIVERTFTPQTDVSLERGIKGADGQKPMDASNGWDGMPRGSTTATTTGWSPGCQCNAEVVPCRVLDPFIGAGTTALVADRLQRDCIGIDLNVGYTRMAMERCIADAPLFTSFPPAEDPEETRMADLFTDMAAD